MELFYWSERWIMDNLPPLPLTLNYTNPYTSFKETQYTDYETKYDENNFSHEYQNQPSFDSYKYEYEYEYEYEYDSYESDDNYHLDF